MCELVVWYSADMAAWSMRYRHLARQFLHQFCEFGFVSTGAVENGYSYATLQWFLIGTGAFVGLFGLSIVTREAGARGAFDFLHQLAVKYLSTRVVVLIKCLFACRALDQLDDSAPSTAIPATENPMRSSASAKPSNPAVKDVYAATNLTTQPNATAQL